MQKTVESDPSRIADALNDEGRVPVYVQARSQARSFPRPGTNDDDGSVVKKLNAHHCGVPEPRNPSRPEVTTR